MVTRGIDTARYQKNPTMLLDHDPKKIFGRVDRLWLGLFEGADCLMGRATILPAGVNAEVDRAYEEMLHGARNGISIRFNPTDVDATPILPAQTGPTYRQSELLEISSTALQSCASAVVTAKALKGRGQPVDVEAWRKWWNKTPRPGGTAHAETQTRVDQDFAEMDAKHAAIVAVEDAWDKHVPRGQMGVMLPKPNFETLDAGYIPKACRSYPLGPARAHRGNLTPSSEIQFDEADMKAILRGLIPRRLREALEKHRGTIDAAIRRTRGGTG